MLRNLKQFHLPEIEEKVLQFWRTNHIFKKSLERNKNGKPFVFYEGPPTANAKPALHHVLARSFKDVVLRYKTMRGHWVPRRAGWDTHGLPVELQVEKLLGISSKKEIEHLVPGSVRESIKLFNAKCRDSVWEFTQDWKRLTERIAFWLDMDNPYITYEPAYIESLWWIIQRAWEKKRFIKGHKVVPWCPRCGTVLSSHEVSQGYKETDDTSVYARFPVTPDQQIGSFVTDADTYILSWTTTPWTLPGNVALAVGSDIEYDIVSVEYDGGDVVYILAHTLADSVLDTLTKKKERRVIATVRGNDLVGIRYQQLFAVPSLQNEKSHKIYAADFVSVDEGTGVVHTAVMYGEDDYRLGVEIGLPQIHTVTEDGQFTDDVPGLAGMVVKNSHTEDAILHVLRENGFLAGTETYRHEYPFCWRCSTPLLYYARDSWFMKMSALRNTLVKENERINWYPAHIKKGRFGEWIRDAKDWAFSRERYWGTPLPVWECANEHIRVIGSLADLDTHAYTKNTFFIMRHAEASANVSGVFATGPESDDAHTSRLTENGLKQAQSVARKLKRKKIDIIYASPYARTRQTAEIVQKATGAKLVFDDRLKEIAGGEFAWRPIAEHKTFYTDPLEEFTRAPEGGESLADVKRRVFSAIRDINTAHKRAHILIVSHGDSLWMLEAAVTGVSNEEALKLSSIGLSKVRRIAVHNWPYADDGTLDLHRPYIDDIILKCKTCRERMTRIKEVADVWFDSGAMPFASVHYPFGRRGLYRRNKNFFFPADYICEAVDQTRGWFYTLLSVAVLLGKKRPFRNVISLGHINDKFGQKMSKSKGNVIDPWEMIDRYGSDTIRWYFYAMNAPGDPKNFNEEDLGKTLRSVILILYNSFVFLETYGAGHRQERDISLFTPVHVLDRWVLARMNECVHTTAEHMERYEIAEAARGIASFIDDISRWYIRRSRRRFSAKDDANEEDRTQAIATLSTVLHTTSILLAPFLPFFAEALYRSLPVAKKKESVHLEDWPQKGPIDRELLNKMTAARHITAQALATRATAGPDRTGIKVRQPLRSMSVRDDNFHIENDKEILDVIMAELNVKEIRFDSALTDEIVLDCTITPELREEGVLREFIRTAQGLRQKAGYRPADMIILHADIPSALKEIISTYRSVVLDEISAKDIQFHSSTAGKSVFDVEMNTKIEEWEVWLAVKRN